MATDMADRKQVNEGNEKDKDPFVYERRSLPLFLSVKHLLALQTSNYKVQRWNTPLIVKTRIHNAR